MFEIHEAFMSFDCKHTTRDQVDLGILEKVPRCRTCGNLFIMGQWHNIPRLVAALIISGADARSFVQYMNDARENESIPYPSYSVEDYKPLSAYLAGQHLSEVLGVKYPVIRRPKDGKSF